MIFQTVVTLAILADCVQKEINFYSYIQIVKLHFLNGFSSGYLREEFNKEFFEISTNFKAGPSTCLLPCKQSFFVAKPLQIKEKVFF